MTDRTGPEPLGRGSRRSAALLTALLVALLPVLSLQLAPAARAADGKPAVTLSDGEAGKGGELTVRGTGWRPDTLLMLLICGQSSPGRGVIGGTNSCANADGRAVTTDKTGGFTRQMPVAEPPRPCPCVVHVATVTGQEAMADAVFVVAGHPSAPLPEQTGGGRLALLATTRLEGDSGLLTWFGAPASRRLVLTVGNLGSVQVKDPVFELGTAHGVFAPRWEEHQWRGTVAPGGKARIELPVELSAGAHGDYQVSLRYGKKVLAEQPWRVTRPWGVTLFWILLCVVVPAAVFRTGMAIVDKVRPRPVTPKQSGRSRGRGIPRGNGLRRGPDPAVSGPSANTSTTAVLPWFTPDSAPSENRPPTKGHS